MSLELALSENTAVMRQLIAVLTSTGTLPYTAPAENETPIAADPAEFDPPKTTRKAKKEAAPEPRPLEQSAPAPDAGATDASETEAAAAPAVEPVTYTQAAEAVTRLIKAKGTPVAKQLLEGFGARNLQGVPKERFGEVIAAVEALLV